MTSYKGRLDMLRMQGVAVSRIAVGAERVRTVHDQEEIDVGPERAVVTIRDPYGVVSDTLIFAHPIEVEAIRRYLRAKLRVSADAPVMPGLGSRVASAEDVAQPQA